jgi:hypothetical protein
MSAGKLLLQGAMAGAALLAALAVPAQAEEQTITAFSVWNIDGSVVQTGEKRATFAGVLEGAVYVETERGPVLAGAISCPSAIDIEIGSGRQHGEARCTFESGEDESRLFADLRCDGVHMIGCSGNFVITGGTGRFASAKGEGPVIIRGDFQKITLEAGPSLRRSAAGIMYWPELRYTLP